jgi:hypothetical protein
MTLILTDEQVEWLKLNLESTRQRSNLRDSVIATLILKAVVDAHGDH